jgi:hypothetical protein
MNDDRTTSVARISAEIFASTGLAEVSRWLIERQHNPVRVDADDLPDLGRHSWLRVARPITAPRAVLCTLWLLDELDRGSSLVAGTLRFVAHPTAGDIKLSFAGLMVRTGRGDDAALQLLKLIAGSIAGTGSASRTEPIRAAG